MIKKCLYMYELNSLSVVIKNDDANRVGESSFPSSAGATRPRHDYEQPSLHSVGVQILARSGKLTV